MSSSATSPSLTDRLRSGEFTGSWVLDSARSTARLRTRSMWGAVAVKGAFATLTGTGEVSPSGDVSGTVSLASASLDTGNNKRDQHLRSADFLDAATYPEIVVTVNTVTTHPTGELIADGSIRVRDVTRPISVPVSVDASDAQVALTAELTVDRSDFGITWNQLGMASMKNVITVSVVFTRS